jgi:2-polyprenyl-3-methyl-5-hydroxy-6-metoxy-1,4-benzoquinol methylase
VSSASLAIAKKRAEIRGLTNIAWIHDSLLNLGRLGLGKFDYINCVGVLHHLENPDDGLRALLEVLGRGWRARAHGVRDLRKDRHLPDAVADEAREW